MKPSELLNWGETALGSDLSFDAKALLSYCTGLKPSEIFLNKKNVSPNEKELYQKFITTKKNGIPTAYITGKTEFMGLNFYVDRNVMIPRQETEILVEEIINIVKPITDYRLPITILDIGTGSGNIAISLAKYIPANSLVKIVATDISKNALKLAERNAESNNVSEKIIFLHSNLFRPITDYRLPITDYDIIISNPPYIKTAEISKLQKEIQYEPRIALDGGKDGFKLYRKVIPGSRKLLKKNGFLILEIGYHHSRAVKKMMKEYNFKNIKIINDYSGRERIIYGYNCN